ncbi:response regulator [Thermodesulfobacterium hveragerdense]|uniref:response regulator n=1 Tax=Thermodesulfobacterium hveragerdense TaxID=53424 RepID=UPI0004072459|nr:response regulator [Thermodesulfobacterium hveragerdense]
MKRVLVVDDAPTVRMYHKKILKDAGFEVDEAVNGLEALEKALMNEYNLYVVDINMPKLDGYSFVKRLRASAEVKQAPVIMVSTEAEEKDKELSYEAGANFYLVKPVKPEDLIKYAKIFTGVGL